MKNWFFKSIGILTLALLLGHSMSAWVRFYGSRPILRSMVVPTPAITASGSTTFCAGDSVILSGPSGVDSYLWSNGETGQSITVKTSGSFTLRTVVGAETSASSSSVTVKVNPIPSTPFAFATGPTTFCPGDSVAIITPFRTGATWLWNTGETGLSIKAKTEGDYSVQVIVGGCTSLPSAAVTVAFTPTTVPVITASGPTTFCAGDSVVLTAGTADSYLWSNGEVGQSITAKNSGDYWVKTTNSAGCQAQSQVTTVVSDTLRVPQITPSYPVICGNSPVTLKADTGSTWLWSTGETSQSITVSAGGIYGVKVANANGCTAENQLNLVQKATIAQPEVVIVSGDTLLCEGDSIVLESPLIKSNVSTFAGTGVQGINNGPLETASFGGQSLRLTADGNGNIFVADLGNEVVRRISIDNKVNTFCGNGIPGNLDGIGNQAELGIVNFIGCKRNNDIYFMDLTNSALIRKFNSLGQVSTIAGGNAFGYADGTGKNALFSSDVTAGVMDSAENFYVADANNYRIRKIVSDSIVSTVAGTGENGYQDGPAKLAKFGYINGLAMDKLGNIYIGETFPNRIRVLDKNGMVSTLAGNDSSAIIDGFGIKASFGYISSICLDSLGNLYASDEINGVIRKISPAGYVSTLAGNDPASIKNFIPYHAFKYPRSLLYKGGFIYVADDGNNLIAKIETGNIDGYIWKNGSSKKQLVIKDTGTYYLRVISGGCTSQVSRVVRVYPKLKTPTISRTGPLNPCHGDSVILTAGNGPGFLWNNGSISQSITVKSTGYYQVRLVSGSCYSQPSAGVMVNMARDTLPEISNLGSLTICPGTSVDLVAKPVTSKKLVNLFAGDSLHTGNTDGKGSQARFWKPLGMRFDSHGFLYSADAQNQVIRKISPQGMVSTYAGNGIFGLIDGPRNNAEFAYPSDVCTDSANNLYIADYRNGSIRKISNSGNVSTLTLNNINGYNLGYVTSLDFDSFGNLYLSDAANNCIAKIDQAGNATIFTGKISESFSTDGTLSDARFRYPFNIKTDINGNMLVLDDVAQNVRLISKTGIVKTIPNLNLVGVDINTPHGLCADKKGNFFFADGKGVIYKLKGNTGQYVVYAGNPNGKNYLTGNADSLFLDASGMAIDSEDNLYLSVQTTSGACILKISPDTTGETYIWNTGATTRGITVSTPGTYSVKAIAKGCTTAPSLPVVVSHSPLSRPASLTNGLSRWFPFNKSNLGYDAGPFANQADSFNLIPIPDRFGNPSSALGFLGNGSFKSNFSASESPKSNAGFSVSCWFKPDSSDTLARNLFIYSDSLNSGNNLQVNINCNGRGSLQIISSDSVTCSSSGLLDTNWSCLVVNFNNTTHQFKVYLNGTYWFKGNLAQILPGAGTLSLSSNSVPNIPLPCSGAFDELMVYNRSLNADEISDIFKFQQFGASSNSPVSAGSDIRLFGGTLSGSIYSWSGPNGFTASGKNVVKPAATAADSGMYILTTQNGNCQRTDTITVSVCPTGNLGLLVSGPTSFCRGDSVVLTAPVSGTYFWNNFAATRSITVKDSGTYAVSVLTASGCNLVSANTHVVVNDLPTGNITPSYPVICGNSAVTLKADTGSTWLWSTGETGQSITVTNPGIYGVKVVNANGCTAQNSFNLYQQAVIGQPVINILSGDTSLCLGDSIVLESPLIKSKVSTIAGTGTPGITNGPARLATFGDIASIAYGNKGNIYIFDNNPSTGYGGIIRKIGTDNLVVTLCGNGFPGIVDGTGNNASINNCTFIGCDTSNSTYFMDSNYQKSVLRKFTTSGKVTTLAGSLPGFADGTGSQANFNYPEAGTIDGKGNIFIADSRNYRIRKIVSDSVVSTIAGTGEEGYLDGPAKQAKFGLINGMAVDNIGRLYLSDSGCSCIRVLDTNGMVSTVAGRKNNNYTSSDGFGTEASFGTVGQMAIDSSNNLYVVDMYQSAIRKISPARYVSTIAGGNYGYQDGDNDTQFRSLLFVAAGPKGSILVADQYNFVVRKIEPGTVDKYIWSNGMETRLITVKDTANINLKVVTAGCTSMASKPVFIKQRVGQPSVSAYGPANPCYGDSVLLSVNNGLGCLWSDGSTSQFVTVKNTGIYRVRNILGTCTSAFSEPITINIAKDTVPETNFKSENFICPEQSVSLIAKPLTNKKLIGIFAGDTLVHGNSNGHLFAARFWSPKAMASDKNGNIYVADYQNHQIRKIDPAGMVSTYAGAGLPGLKNGRADTAEFSYPKGLAIDSKNNLYVLEGTSTIRIVSPGGLVSTFINPIDNGYAYFDGNLSVAQFGNDIKAIEIDKNDNVYLADGTTIRKIDTAGNVTTFAGTAYESGANDGPGTQARLVEPRVIKADTAGNILIIENYNTPNPRLISKTGYVSTLKNPLSSDTTHLNTLTYDKNGNFLISDGTGQILTLNASTGHFTRFAGTANGKRNLTGKTDSLWIYGDGLLIDRNDNLYISSGSVNANNGYIRKISPDTTAESYLWNTGETTRGISVSSPGTYSVKIFAAGCTTPSSLPVVVKLNPASVPASVLTDMLLWYPMDGNSPGTDASGHNKNATVQPGQSVPDRFGNPNSALHFDGTTSLQVDFPDSNDSPKKTPAWAFSFWINTKQTDLARLVQYKGTAENNTNNYDLVLNDITCPAGYLSAIHYSQARGYCSSNPFPTNKWVHIYAEFNKAANQSRVYLNGNLWFIGQIKGTNPPGYGKLKISGLVDVAAGWNFVGSMDEFMVFKRGLTNDEIYNLYDLQNSGVKANSPVFSGQGIHLKAVALSGASYLWSGPNGFTATQASTSINNASLSNSGTYTLTTTTGNCQRIDTVSVKVCPAGSPVVSAIGSTAFCIGDSVILTTSTQADAYFWSNGNTTKQITVNKTGNYSLQTTTGGCASEISTPITVTANSQPARPVIAYPDGLIIPQGDSIALVVNPDTLADTVSTFAGSRLAGFADGNAASAQFNNPSMVAVDATGTVYVADSFNNRIRKILPNGQVITVAGSGAGGFKNGQDTTAQFSYPAGVAIDRGGNLYITDTQNNSIRKITPQGMVSTFAGTGQSGFADGPGNTAMFNLPSGIATDFTGNVYVVDTRNVRIRKITPSGLVSTLAGNGLIGGDDGPADSAKFFDPYGIAVDLQGNVFVTEGDIQRIRKISAKGMVSTIAGSGTKGFQNGQGLASKFNYPAGITIDLYGNLYVADNGNNCIRKISPSGYVSTFAGDTAPGYKNGTYQNARFKSPAGIACDLNGNLYLSDLQNECIRKITHNNTLTSFAWSNGANTSKIMVKDTGTYSMQIIANGCTSVASVPVKVGRYGKFTVSGQLKTETGQGIRSANVNELKGQSTQSDRYGNFYMPYDGGKPLRITANKTNDTLKANGITTIDCLLMTWHILGTQRLKTPYKLIAGDVNLDTTITTLDEIIIRDLILGRRKNFFGRTWRFVPSKLGLDTLHPYPKDTSLIISKLVSDSAHQNFIGIKLGDLNNSWNPNIARLAASRSIGLNLPNQQYGRPGSTIMVPVMASGFTDVASLQFTLSWDATKADFLGLEPAAINNLQTGTTELNNGNLAVSWVAPLGKSQSFGNQTVLFYLKLQLKPSAIGQIALELGNRMIDVEAGDGNANLLNLPVANGSILLGTPTGVFVSDKKLSLNVYPNPFENKTQITFSLPNASAYSLVISNTLGQVVANFNGKAEAGNHEIHWGRNDETGKWLPSGTYFCQLTTESGTRTVKMLLE